MMSLFTWCAGMAANCFLGSADLVQRDNVLIADQLDPNPALLFSPNCVTLEKLVNLSGLHIPHLEYRDKEFTMMLRT